MEREGGQGRGPVFGRVRGGSTESLACAVGSEKWRCLQRCPGHPSVSVTELSFGSFPVVTLIPEQTPTAENKRSSGSRAEFEALRAARGTEQGGLGELPPAELTRC